MNPDELKTIIRQSREMGADFFSAVFSQVVSGSKREGLLELLDLKEEALFSLFFDLSKLQDSYRFRSQRRSVLIAEYLIDEKGAFDKERLDFLLKLFAEEGEIFYPNGKSDSELSSHFVFVLKKFQENPDLLKRILRFRVPLCHMGAEGFVLESLGLLQGEILTDSLVRRAVLSACLNSLRQNVGSCFATAPAILIQKEQIENLLADLHELLMTGKLTRVFGGVEFSVPLSPSSGGGDLHKTLPLEGAHFSPGLMKAFEAIGLVSSELTLQQKSDALLEIIQPFLGQKKIKELIHEVLLRHFEITEEDLALEKKKMASFFKQKKLTIDTRAGPLQKGQRCEKMLQFEKKAFSAFKSVVDHALLKAWEFTLASFSEIKMDFSGWNLYSSLGFNHEEPGGIGEILYKALAQNLEENQKKAEMYHEEYIVANDQLRATETLLAGAATESDIRRLKAEFNTRLYHMRACLEMRDEFYTKSSYYSKFFSFLLESYNQKFPEYFQEIYDAEMQDFLGKQYEDSPAGFRLVYKHGRSNAFLWTLVQGPQEYIDALVDFFLAVEPQIAALSDWAEAPRLLSELTTAIVSHVRTEEFLKTAFQRMAKAHKQVLPLDSERSLEDLEKKPWAYTSGGNMSILLKTYYRRENEMTQESRWVESPSDLLIFLLDVLKNTPLSTSELLTYPHKGMLVSSPSHAFTIYPSWPLFKEGWQDPLFTYTWVRDKVVASRKAFYEAIVLTPYEQAFLVEEFAKTLSVDLLFRLNRALTGQDVSIPSFRNGILSEVGSFLEELIDSFLYESLPIVRESQLQNKVELLLDGIEVPNLEALLPHLVEIGSEYFTAKQVQEIAKTFYIAAKGSVCLSFDLHKWVAQRAESIFLSPPAPFLFADTNWTGYYFGFVVNPGTLLLELWRLDRIGLRGYPMTTWAPSLNGQNKDTWNVYSRPLEYGFTI